MFNPSNILVLHLLQLPDLLLELLDDDVVGACYPEEILIFVLVILGRKILDLLTAGSEE